MLIPWIAWLIAWLIHWLIHCCFCCLISYIPCLFCLIGWGWFKLNVLMTHDIVLRTPIPSEKKWQIGVAADKKLSKAPLEVPVSNWLLSRCWELVLPVVIILTSPFRKGLFGQQQQVRPLNQRTDKSATLQKYIPKVHGEPPAPVIFVCFQKCAHAINVDVYHLSTGLSTMAFSPHMGPALFRPSNRRR